MTNWPISRRTSGLDVINDAVDHSASTGFLLLPFGDDGAWTEYSASWPATTNELDILYTSSGNNRFHSIEVAVGSSNKQVFLHWVKQDYGAMTAVAVKIPVTIYKGESVFIRHDTTGSLDNPTVTLIGQYNPLIRNSFRGCDLVGASGPSIVTTTPDPGATLNTKGAWAEIVASTARDYNGLMLVFCNANDTNTATVNHLFDIGFGATPVVAIPDIPVIRSGRSTVIGKFFFLPIDIPAGTKVSARCQADNNTAGVRNLVSVHFAGFY